MGMNEIKFNGCHPERPNNSTKWDCPFDIELCMRRGRSEGSRIRNWLRDSSAKKRPQNDRVALIIAGVTALFLMSSSLRAAPVPGDLVWKVNTSTKVVALTFDDGPDKIYTDKILALLKEHNAKGTFFMLGENAIGKEDVVRRVIEQGHEVESHTYSHVNYAKIPAETGAQQLADSMVKTQDILEKASGKRPQYVRMPHGIDRPWIRDVARQQGVVLVNWSFGYDWFNQSKEDMVRNYTSNVKPGVIILMHDGGKRQKTVDVLRDLLKALDAKGYQAVTVEELLRTYPPTPLPTKKKK